MTTARFQLEMESGSLIMDVRGHAGFAELGKDPVCAGASVLAMTVAQCVYEMGRRGKLKKKPNVKIRNGRVTVVAKPEPEYFHEALHLFWIGQVGMQLLEESYPEHIQLSQFETVPGDVAGKAQESGTDSINTKESST